MLSYIVLLPFFLIVLTAEDEGPLLKTSFGLLKGHYKKSYGGRTFSAFEGIPYAKPPVGELRFQEPQKAEKWSGTWNATLQHECIQFKPPTFTVIGDEDCLYLNVYIPRKEPVKNENLNVIVYIHGGAFMFANPAMGGPEYLMDRDIAYVSINYRLGIIGFLSTEDELIPGNNGMKDQVLALQWVQENIEDFGGNPKSVTLLGLSAGGSAVHFHYFSPLSKGLFHRGISQSGTALVPWALQEASLEKAKKLASVVGCDQSISVDFLKCLQEKPAEQLVQSTQDFYGFHDYPLAPFAPVIEKETKNAFLTDHPYELLVKGDLYDVPWIASVTKDEGVFPVITWLDKLDEIEKRWGEVLPHLLDYNYTVSEAEKNNVAKKIKDKYFGGEPLSLKTISSVISVVGDRYFKVGFEKAVRIQARKNKSPVYSYIYGYQGEQTLSTVFGLEENYGIGHGEDGFLLHHASLFEKIVKKDKLRESDEQIKDLLVDIVTSFANNGYPSPEQWKPVTNSNEFSYLAINGPNDIKMVTKDTVSSIHFWHSLPIFEDEKILNIKDEL